MVSFSFLSLTSHFLLGIHIILAHDQKTQARNWMREGTRAGVNEREKEEGKSGMSKRKEEWY